MRPYKGRVWPLILAHAPVPGACLAGTGGVYMAVMGACMRAHAIGRHGGGMYNFNKMQAISTYKRPPWFAWRP